MSKPGNTGIRRIIRAMGFSSQGLAAAWKHEAAFRQEIVLLVILVPTALWLGETVLLQALLIGVCLLVLIVELFNSAIEAAIDRHGEEQHELSGRAKDMGSAAVLISLMIVLLTWGAVICDRFFTGA
jgi:diacylglycerol kinase (ATP)